MIILSKIKPSSKRNQIRYTFLNFLVLSILEENNKCCDSMKDCHQLYYVCACSDKQEKIIKIINHFFRKPIYSFSFSLFFNRYVHLHLISRTLIVNVHNNFSSFFQDSMSNFLSKIIRLIQREEAGKKTEEKSQNVCFTQIKLIRNF